MNILYSSGMNESQYKTSENKISYDRLSIYPLSSTLWYEILSYQVRKHLKPSPYS